MKIRNGFVSNSSSSSFCIFGVKIEEDKFINKLQKVFNLKISKKSCEEENNYEIIEELTSKIEEKYKIEVHSTGFDSILYVGKSWKTINGDQTGNQFKEEVNKNMKELFGVKKCETLEEAWMDG